MADHEEAKDQAAANQPDPSDELNDEALEKVAGGTSSFGLHATAPVRCSGGPLTGASAPVIQGLPGTLVGNG